MIRPLLFSPPFKTPIFFSLQTSISYTKKYFNFNLLKTLILSSSMAATATSNLPMAAANPVPAKKGRGRKALKDKNPSTNEANILAAKSSEPLDLPAELVAAESDPMKENLDSFSHPKSEKKKSKAKSKVKKAEDSSNFEKELQEMQDMLEKLKIEKEKTEEILKEKDEILKKKDEEQQKLQLELKKLQKMKEFKPTMTLPVIQTLKDKELEKKDKKKKDPQERKRPAPAYALWCKDQWNEIKKENPDADFKEISNIMGAKWKTITPEEKKPYEEKHQADKEAYLQIMGNEKRETEAMKLLEEEQKQKTAMELLNQYLEFKQEADKDTKKTKKEKDPAKPKQPMSAFFLYSNERRADLLGEGNNLLEASKIIGEEWKKMTEQKRHYEEIAKENKEKYQQEMEVYKQKKKEEAASLKKEEDEFMKVQKVEALQLLKKKEKTDNIIKKTKELKKKTKEAKKVDPNKPKRPPSSFLLFSVEERKNLLKERPEANNSTITALISLKWKELNEEEKKIWNEKAAEKLQAYKKEMEEYKQTAEQCNTVLKHPSLV